MKQPDSNPKQTGLGSAIRGELARVRAAEPHPDEDVLTAFAEGALLERERGSVMEHLAACARCREVVHLASAAAPEAAEQQQEVLRPARPTLRSWLPWVASAAGFLVVTSAVVVHERRLETAQSNAGKPALVAKEVAPPALPLPQAETPGLAKTAPGAVAPSRQREAVSPFAAEKTAPQALDELQSQDQAVLQSRDKGTAQAGSANAALQQFEQKKTLPESKALRSMASQYNGAPMGVVGGVGAQNQAVTVTPVPAAPPPPAPVASAPQLQVHGVSMASQAAAPVMQPNVGATTETVAVTQAPLLATEDATAGTATLQARKAPAPAFSNAAPAAAAAKASAAQSSAGQGGAQTGVTAGVATQTAGSYDPNTATARGSVRSLNGMGSLAGLAARAHWRISDAGRAERAFGNGPWQAALPQETAKMRVVAVSGADVWVGGEAMHLWHSADNGVTWKAVSLPVKDGGSHAIVHIRFDSAQAGTVEDDAGTQWKTADGGRTWQ